MQPWGTWIIVFSYILGLLGTGLYDKTVGGLSWIGIGLLIAGLLAGQTLPRRYWRIGPTRRQWISAGIVGMLAASYCIARIPAPGPNDVSHFASRQEQVLTAQVIETAKTNRQNKGQLLVNALSIRSNEERPFYERPREVSGKVYVTAPLAPSKRLYPGEVVQLTGRLSQPRTDTKQVSGFARYLAQQNCFAQMQVRWVTFVPDQSPPNWALWKVRARIVNAQGYLLGEETGALLSAITLGRRAVDLPVEIKDSFIQAGLAHTLAASGFHVSLLLVLVLSLLSNRTDKTKAIAGICSLIGYVSLTGLQPSIMRASLMGAGALLGNAIERKLTPLSGLTLAICILLLWNPQWIWDVGFQLSVVATFGLIVTVPALLRYLEWLPSKISAVVAVPIAAFIWTLPLQLLYFERISLYSILLNVLLTPLIIVVSIGGIFSAIAAIFLPILGSLIADCLYYFLRGLMWMVTVFNHLPGSHISVTFMNVGLVVCCYVGLLSIVFGRYRRYKARQRQDFELSTNLFGL